MSNNKVFAEYVTNTAFHLTLSRNMCWMLIAIAEDSDDRYHFGRNVPTLRNLQERGLVSHHPTPVTDMTGKHRYWQLTEAGELVFKLVKLAGLNFEGLIPKSARKSAWAKE